MQETQEVPIKVDLTDGADGLEIIEIITSLRFRATAIATSNSFQAKYLSSLADKYQTIFKQREMQLLKILQEKHFSS